MGTFMIELQCNYSTSFDVVEFHRKQNYIVEDFAFISVEIMKIF